MSKRPKRLFERIPIRKEEGMKAWICQGGKEFDGYVVDLCFRGLGISFELNKIPSYNENEELKAKLDLSGCRMEVVLRMASQVADLVGFEFVDMLDIDRERLADLMEAKLTGRQLEPIGEVTKDPNTGCSVFRYQGPSDELLFLWYQDESKKLKRLQCVVHDSVLEWEQDHLRNALLTESVGKEIIEQGWIPSSHLALSLRIEPQMVWFVKTLLFASPINDALKASLLEVFV